MKNALLVMRSKGAVVMMSACAVVVLTGCASNGMALNTAGGNRVDRSFIEGTITKQQKVIIDDRETATLTGLGVGAVGGAAVGGMGNGSRGAMTGGILGALAGGVTGALVGKEIEAYQTTITADNGQTYQGYLQQRLNDGNCVEFTIVEEKLKNVNVITCKPKPIIKQVEKVEAPKQEVVTTPKVEEPKAPVEEKVAEVKTKKDIW